MLEYLELLSDRGSRWYGPPSDSWAHDNTLMLRLMDLERELRERGNLKEASRVSREIVGRTLDCLERELGHEGLLRGAVILLAVFVEHAQTD